MFEFSFSWDSVTSHKKLGKNPGIVVHVYNSRTVEAEARKQKISGQPGL